MNYAVPQSISFTSPAAAGTAIHTTTFKKLARYQDITIVGDLVGATGGTLDIYLQYKVVIGGTNRWVDWLHFVQLASGGAAARYQHDTRKSLAAAAPIAVGLGTDASAGVVLAAATFAGGLPSDEVRIVAVAGVSTSAGAVTTITLIGHHPAE